MRDEQHSSRVALTNVTDSSIAHTHTHTVEEKGKKLKRRREREREARQNESELQKIRKFGGKNNYSQAIIWSSSLAYSMLCIS